MLSYFKQQTFPFWQLALLSALYFCWFYAVVGLRAEHVWVYFLLLLLYFIHPATRKFLFGYAAFIVYVFKYDSLRALPNYTFNPVHIADLYQAEKTLFGITLADGKTLTLNEWALQHTHPVADFLSGLWYGSWIPIPMLFGFYLFLYHKPLFLRFMYGFVLTGFLGTLIYYLYPAAPPWYVALHGVELNTSVIGNAAGLLRFDALVGAPVFENFYSNAPAPFAAMPSLHAAFPAVCFLYGRQLRRRWVNVAFGLFAAGMWCTAIYTGHHYLLDVLAGIATAITAYLLLYLFTQSQSGKTFFGWLLLKIT